ncbi:MAG: HAMP domain-containing histidine kinase [Acidobacteria bacterium]|nr:HAMP domain-containing histidine kinase [Acidobacteriota bacterium]
MRISTRITAGYVTLIGLMVGLMVYEVMLIHRMASTNRDLAQINFRAAGSSLQLLRDVDQLEEFTGKFFIRKDPDYASKLVEVRSAFAADLESLRELSRTVEERSAIGEIARSFEDYTAEAVAAEQTIGQSPDDNHEYRWSALIVRLEQLRTQITNVFQITRQEIRAQVDRSTETGLRAEKIAWGVALAAVLLSLIVSLLIVRSILRPLGRLTEGTRAIAEGNFLFQLDDSGADEFSQLAGDFNTMTHRLEELDQMKKDFVSHVSHELKAPLASIQETNRLLLEQIPGPLVARQQRLLELNQQSAVRLSAMIANLLDLSRIEAGVMQYDFTGQNLNDLVLGVVAELDLPARARGLCVEVDLPQPPLTIECDEVRITQVVRNLLDNAIKFSPQGGHIAIHARPAPEVPAVVPASAQHQLHAGALPKGYALISVTDAGHGIPDEHKGRVFERFHQVRRGRKISGQGAGLGLAICRTIVETHRGAIWAADGTGGGATFCILLPVEAAARDLVRQQSTPL